MSESKTPQAGEWWETRLGDRAYVAASLQETGQTPYSEHSELTGWINNGHSLSVRSWSRKGRWRAGSDGVHDLVKHLPDCTGWDWVEPQKSAEQVVVSFSPYVVSLETYEKVVAERNALQDRLREIEAKAKFS